MVENTEKKVVKAAEEAKEKEIKRSIVSKKKLLEAGTYFGHKKSQWNPKMKDFLYPQTKRGIHIINSQATIQRLEFAYNILLKFVAKNPRASFIFVGTKKQAKETIKDNALRTNSFYVTDRWLGGTLTNSSTIFKRVSYMEELERQAENNFEGRTKKEKILLQKELDKLHKNLDGIRNMKGIPTFMIVADPNTDLIAVKEARRKGVKVIGIIDSNTDPDLVDFGIPANDDSAKSITLIITILADAIAVGRGGKEKFAYKADELIELPKFEKPAQAENNFRPRGERSAEGENKRVYSRAKVEDQTSENKEA
ncbi:30S ribosomal protein S2, partial [Mycoplasmopsis opalescens]|uniref:30S ribosomal protein S2 n=1 Tax=Mycoplasmopsis opalescens TaxID=114886 RepID=UPI0004A75A39